MHTVALAAAKGGVGKTTLASALGVAACLVGHCSSVALVDLDPQGSLTHWWNRRRSDQPALASLDGASLRSVRESLRRGGADLLIVDCPPGFSSIMEEAIRAADLVVVPTSPGSLDLEAIASTVEMARRGGVPHCCVLNRAQYRSRLAGQAVRDLRGLDCRLLPVVHNRVAVAEAMAAGRTALETAPSGAAARELSALWHAVRAELDRPRGGLSRTATTSHGIRIGGAAA